MISFPFSFMSYRSVARLSAALGVVAVLSACNFLPQSSSTPTTPPPAPVAPTQTPPVAPPKQQPSSVPIPPSKPTGVPSLDKKFTNAKEKLTLQYPSTWKEETNATVKTQIATVKGTAFVLKPDAKSMLLESRLIIGVEKTCPKQPIGSTNVVNGVTIKQSNWSEPGKESISEGSVYTMTTNNKCYVVASIIRSCELGKPCAKTHAQSFDKASLYRLFDAIVQSIRFTK